jgi:hypothetical protein
LDFFIGENKMGRPLKIQKANTTKDIGFPQVSTLTNPVTPDGLDSAEFYGVVGGDQLTTTTANGGTSNFPTIGVRVYIAGQDEQDGYILRAKGSRKFLVYDPTNGASGVCTLSDEADSALTSGSMTITVYTGDSTAIRLKRITNKWGVDWNNNRWFLNFFQGVEGETAIKSGAANNGTVTLARVEQSS